MPLRDAPGRDAKVMSSTKQHHVVHLGQLVSVQDLGLSDPELDKPMVTAPAASKPSISPSLKLLIAALAVFLGAAVAVATIWALRPTQASAVNHVTREVRALMTCQGPRQSTDRF